MRGDTAMDTESKAGKLILETLRKAKKPLSTYQVAKLAQLSWPTANSHCYRLKSSGVLDSKSDEVKIGVKRIIWWIK